MPQNFPAPLLSRLSEFVAGTMGLNFPQDRWRDLERGIRSAAVAFDATDAESCAEWLLSAPLTKAQIATLASELTVGETYFFRENRSFEILGERILPALIRERQDGDRRLRIWSAGCCTGEEAYSIAILLDRILPERHKWHVMILATDINPRFLKKASEGIYGEWSFRNPPVWLKTQYFRPVNDRRYEILPRIKKMVTFLSLNLAEDTFPSLSTHTNAMDLIFCRNVLMYFAPDGARRVIHNFHRTLLTGGWLIVSPTETSNQLFAEFAPVRFEGAVFYRKSDAHTPGAANPFAATQFDGMEAPQQMPVPVPDVYFPVVEPQSSLPAQVPEAEAAQPVEPGPDAYKEALALYERGDYQEAASILNTAAGAGAADLALMARICANLGQLAEAKTWAEKAIDAGKLDAGLHYLLAIILQEQDDLGHSMISLKRALYLDPDFVLAHYALGNLALKQHRTEESARHFANALGLLDRYGADDVLPQSDGLVAGRLKAMLKSTMAMEASA